MNVVDIIVFLGTVAVAGGLGAAAMEGVMWLFSRSAWAKGSMIVALGSLFTRSHANAARVGLILHAMSALVFATAYALLMLVLQAANLPLSLAVGLGAGLLQGVLVSLALVWVVADHHPLPEYQEADLAIGLSHLLGHVAFGGVVGLVVGLAPF